MATKLAYQVSYIIENRNGDLERQDEYIRFFATREQAVARAQHLTANTHENNGVWVGGWWWAQKEGAIDPDNLEEFRVSATVETVTLDEIEASL